MARSKQIDFRRVTFSFPAEVLDDLRIKIDKNNMSGYVAQVVKKDLEKKKSIEQDENDFLEDLRNFAKENKKHYKSKKTTLEILREIRYGKKY